MSLSTGSGTVEGAILPDCPVLDPGLFFARIIGGLEIPLGGARVPGKLPGQWFISRAERAALPGAPLFLCGDRLRSGAHPPLGGATAQRLHPSQTTSSALPESNAMLRVDESKSSQCFELGSQVPIPESPCFLGPLTNANVSMGGLGELPSSVKRPAKWETGSPRRQLNNLNNTRLLLKSKVLDGERRERVVM